MSPEEPPARAPGACDKLRATLPAISAFEHVRECRVRNSRGSVFLGRSHPFVCVFVLFFSLGFHGSFH